MNSLKEISDAEVEFRATRVWFDDTQMMLHLADGRELHVPLEFYPKLKNANASVRENYEPMLRSKVLGNEFLSPCGRG